MVIVAAGVWLHGDNNQYFFDQDEADDSWCEHATTSIGPNKKRNICCLIILESFDSFCHYDNLELVAKLLICNLLIGKKIFLYIHSKVGLQKTFELKEIEPCKCWCLNYLLLGNTIK